MSDEFKKLSKFIDFFRDGIRGCDGVLGNLSDELDDFYFGD